MGSCENTTLVDEPLREVAASAAKQHSRSESVENLETEQRGCIVIDSNGVCAGESCEDENTGSERSGNIDCEGGTEGDIQMVGMKELVGEEFCDSAACLRQSRGESADDSCSKVLMGDMGGLGGDDSTVCFNKIQSENVGGAGSKELIGDKDGDCMLCLNENQDENVDEFGVRETMGDRCGDTEVCLKDNQGENIDSSGPLELMGNGDSICYSNVNQGENVNGSGPEELMGNGGGTWYSNENQCENVDGSGPSEVMANSDGTCYTNENQGENIDPSGSKELMGARIGDDVVCLDESQSNIDIQNSETDWLCLENKGSSDECGPTAIDEPIGLSHDENTACLSSGTENSTNCEDEMKGHNKNVVGLVLKECMENEEGLFLTENQRKVDHYFSENDASQDSQMPLELKPVTASPRTCVKWDNQKDDESVSGSLLQGTKIEASSEIVNSTENACCLKGDSFELGAKSLSDKPVSLSCQPSDVVENGLCGRLDPPDVLTNDACAAISSSSSIDCSRQRENEGNDVVKADCVSETKHHPIASSSSRRGSRKSRPNRKTPAKRVSRNCRSGKLSQPHESIEFLFKASRKKRSCSSKPARSSLWGLFSNITQFLELIDDPECNGVQNQEPSKAGGGRGSGKRSKNRAGLNRKGSSGLCKTLTSCLRLKIKVSKEVATSNLNSMGAEVDDPSVSVDTSISNYGKSMSLQFPKLTNVVEDKVGEVGSERQFQSKDQEKEKTCSDASITDLKQANEVVVSAENPERSAEDAADINLVSQSEALAETSGEAIQNKYDPGTSPDSEVINSIPDAQVGLLHQDELHDTVLNTSGALASLVGVNSSKGSKMGKKDNRRSPGAASIRKPKSLKNCKGRSKSRGNGLVSTEALTSSTGANASGENGLGVSEEAVKVEINMDAKVCCSSDVLDTKNTKNFSSSRNKQNQPSKSSKSRGRSKGRSQVSESVRSRKGIACKQRGDRLKSVSQRKVKEKGSNEEIVATGGKHPLTGNHISDDIRSSNTGNSIASLDMINVDLVSDGGIEQYTQPNDAWVRCDDCYKWRRIPAALVESVSDECRWFCRDNIDKSFADCSIPQEKSNAEINAELGISDAEDDGCDGLNYKELEKGFESKRMTVLPPASHFWRIDSNQFLHRARKTQTIDEIMVCHCKQPPDGKFGCGDECLNRILNIECVQGTCPCGDLCSNQQFQKRKYAKMTWDRFGKKGFGLRTLENISAGQFLIEYVGEVLDMQAYEARQKEYASRGQRHFYFMTLNGSEVIDAYVKGNLGRFINHSCDPNCQTEKWMVNGEICIGLFALRDIKKGEEVTFDYNYVRVFGAAAKKCHCGSPHCRGYIGGDPLSSEVIVHDGSDEESPEPVMLEDGETWKGSKNIISRSSSFDGAEKQSTESVITDGVMRENMPETEESVYHSASATSKLKSPVETEDLMVNFQLTIQPEEVLPKTDLCEVVQQDDSMEQNTKNKTSSSIQKLDTSPNMSDNKLPSDTVDANKKSKFMIAEDKHAPSKSRPLMKTSRSSSSIKKGKISTNSLNGNKIQLTSNKSQVPSSKPKKLSENPSTCRFETVEEKLNELLDSEGGITRRKDASKGYLKLLLLTATSGDSGNGEAIQSNRELSMILDALLKTKSRAVLTDIINKNGLQMLHNIMKKYRRDFKKIPILRKLLKVLEYLAMREILTLEHINGGPPCAGRESFRESILSFTEHDDKQVHQIARNFRDKWIPKPVRKHSYRDRDDGRMEFHRGSDSNRVSSSHNHWRDQAIRPTEAVSCIMQTKSVVATSSVDTFAREGSSSSTGVCQINGAKIRKRKSRWDQPAETEKTDLRSPKKLEYSSLPILPQSTSEHIDKMSRWDKECRDHFRKGEAINVDNGRQSFQEDVPPGFSSTPNASLVSSVAPSTAVDFQQPECPDVIIAHPQERFISRLPVSYGIPLPVLQQFGTPKGKSVESWVIAPGMAFHPFPPLPPYPRDKPDTPHACVANSTGMSEDAKEAQQDSCRPATSFPDENMPSTPCGNPQLETDTPGTNIQQTFKRTRESSYDLCKKYFRQQKRKGPPWEKFENNIGGTCCIDVGNVKNEIRNSYCSDDINL